MKEGIDLAPRPLILGQIDVKSAMSSRLRGKTGTRLGSRTLRKSTMHKTLGVRDTSSGRLSQMLGVASGYGDEESDIGDDDDTRSKKSFSVKSRLGMTTRSRRRKQLSNNKPESGKKRNDLRTEEVLPTPVKLVEKVKKTHKDNL